MSLGPGKRPRPVVSKISQPQPRTPSADHAVPHPDLDSRADMTFDGRDIPYQVAAADLEILGSLGRGQYGQVDRVRHRGSGFEFAVKRIRSTDDAEERKRMLMDLKVNQMSCGRCPYVVISYGALFFEGDLWICMEVMDISLEQFYKNLFGQERNFPDEILGFITFAVVSGLQFLKEELNIMHRDVKPSNILLSRKGEVKICDFGISGQLVQSLAKTRNVGCSLYMSPERVSPSSEESAGFDIRSDVWSLAITMIEVATGTHPYTKWKNPFQQMREVVDGDPPSLPNDGRFTEDFRDLIYRCCKKKAEERPKYVELLKHPFISRFQDSPLDISQFAISVIDV